MIDHILAFSDEASAKSALPQYVSKDENGAIHWNASVGIYGQTVTVTPAVWDNTDPRNPVLVTPAVTLPGFWLSLGLKEQSQELIDLPNYALRFTFNRNTGTFGYLAPSLNQALLATAKIEPTFAGVNYPFNG